MPPACCTSSTVAVAPVSWTLHAPRARATVPLVALLNSDLCNQGGQAILAEPDPPENKRELVDQPLRRSAALDELHATSDRKPLPRCEVEVV